jgi:hypothetical protein
MYYGLPVTQNFNKSKSDLQGSMNTVQNKKNQLSLSSNGQNGGSNESQIISSKAMSSFESEA